MKLNMTIKNNEINFASLDNWNAAHNGDNWRYVIIAHNSSAKASSISTWQGFQGLLHMHLIKQLSSLVHIYKQSDRF